MISRARTLLFLILLIPGVAFAQLQVTEVMYDAPGSDTGHEWIALTTTEQLDLNGYSLFEGGVHHALKVAQGTSTLAAGEKAIITTSPEQYLVDYPTYTGTIFKSSFSLSNSGETFSVTDSSKKEVATYSYTAPPPQPKVPVSKPTTKAVSKKPTIAAAQKASTTGATSSTTPAASTNNTLWWSLGGLLVVVVLGMAGIFLIDTTPQQKVETSPATEEFEIE